MDLFDPDPPKKAEPLEVIMTREVMTRYLETMRNNWQFHETPYLDIDWFRHHFADVAHHHRIFHGEDRHQYNLYFGLVRTRMSTKIKRLLKNKQEQEQKKLAGATQTEPPPTPHLSVGQPKQVPLPLEERPRIPPSAQANLAALRARLVASQAVRPR